jgi:hypothetical protein
MTHGDPFFGWRGYIELALTRRMEADGMAYWTGRDVAMGLVQKAKGLRALYKKGLTPNEVAGRILDRPSEDFRGAHPAGARVSLPPGTTRG